ncbi:relaxase/mobilization nuclease domain-containing protein [Pseudomonas sp. LS-2]|uniref:relaxase/mobilization nuclease domain-containing protein n=1 Tax=Pseudomonas sp. LS-2 TaxID=2315859 RepID=UPI000E725549|nr:relaxase/mobilization nuclease domain-containing protein [Pseudomonas sp. LS-2]RJX74024.1 hypothetical protein D3M70_27320 [Pseudomonas sp. LS-2]
MKGMQKISRGSSFSGVMAYAFDGDVDNLRALEGEVLGGNMSGHDPKSLAREFGASKAVRPEVAKPVWHNSLRLPAGDTLTKYQWVAIGDAYMAKMGFSENHQRVYVLHDDKAGQHIHIVASRIALDGNLFLGKNENLISTKIIADLEKEFNLTITKGADYENKKVVMPDRSRPTKGEVGKFERTGESPSRFVLAELIDQAIADKPTASKFAERLNLAGVEVRANFSKNKLNGFSFGLDGIGFKGSQLGKQYTGKALFGRGLTYEQDRDYAELKQYSSAAKELANADRDRASDSTTERDNLNVRRADRSRINRANQSTVERSGADQGLGEHSSRHNEFGDGVPEADSSLAESSNNSIEKHPRAKSYRENACRTAPGHGSGSVVTDQYHHSRGSDVTSGVELSNVGPMHTGDEATDNLNKLAHQAAMKEANETMARQRRNQAEYDVVLKRRFAEAQATMNQLLGIGDKPIPFSYEKAQLRPYSARLISLSGRVTDPNWRDREIAQFANAVGADGFDLAFYDPGKKRGSTKKSLSADQLVSPRTVRGLTSHFSRNGDVAARPQAGDSKGVILLTGLTDEALQKLEAAGFSPAATIDVAGKKQAWCRADETLTAEARHKLLERLSDLTGVLHQDNAYGRLPGFSRGTHTATLVSATGHSATALKDHLNEIRSEILDNKISLRLDQAVLSRATLDKDDFDHVGSTKYLKPGWFQETRDRVKADVMNRTAQVSNERIEAKILEAMARQKVPVSQAYRAVISESRFCAGIELKVVSLVSHAYKVVALETEGEIPAGVDIDSDARQRFPELMPCAKSGIDSEQNVRREQLRIDAMNEQRALERQEDDRRRDRALEAALSVSRAQARLTRG